MGCRQHIVSCTCLFISQQTAASHAFHAGAADNGFTAPNPCMSVFTCSSCNDGRCPFFSFLVLSSLQHTCIALTEQKAGTRTDTGLCRRRGCLHPAPDPEAATRGSQRQQNHRAHQSQAASLAAPNSPFATGGPSGAGPPQPAGPHGHASQSTAWQADADRHSGDPPTHEGYPAFIPCMLACCQ